MGAGHSHALYVHRHSPVHALAPEVKIAASVLFTVVVVATPREELWAFGGYLAVVVVVASIARIGLGRLALRSLIELPFILFAFALPFLGHGERVHWLGMSLSVDGLYGMWNILAKGTLGVLSSLLLAGTTTPRDLLLGLDRLRCPTMITQIATFMLRYLDVLSAEGRRMRIAQRHVPVGVCEVQAGHPQGWRHPSNATVAIAPATTGTEAAAAHCPAVAPAPVSARGIRPSYPRETIAR